MTFSKQLSQRLQELGIDIPDSGLWWVQDITHGEWRFKTGKKSGSDWEESYPALSLSNLLCLLPEIIIGERCADCDSPETYCTCKTEKFNEIRNSTYFAHQILNIFLNKSEEQAYKLSEEYILKLIK